MQTLFYAFPYTRIINLRERTDRRRETEEEFARIGVPIDGDRIDFFTTDKFDDAAGFSTLGARGAFTSHMSVLEHAIEAGHNRVLVLEDDIHFTSADPTSAMRDLERLEWDIVYFGYLNLPGMPTIGDGLVSYGGPTRGGQFYAVQEPYLSTMVAFMRSCLTRPGGHPDGGPMFRDGAYNFYRERHPDLRQFLALPNLGGQRSSRTDLHELQAWDRIKALRPIVEAARQFRNKVRSRS